MPEIAKIDYLNAPLYDMAETPGKNIALLDRIIRYAEQHGQDPERLFIHAPTDVQMLDFGFHESGRPVADFSQSLEQFYWQSLRLAKALNTSVANLYTMAQVNPINQYGREPLSFEKDKGPFERFLKQNNLTLADHVTLIGHGLHRDACVKEALDRLEQSLESTHPEMTINRYENEDTTY